MKIVYGWQSHDSSNIGPDCYLEVTNPLKNINNKDELFLLVSRTEAEDLYHALKRSYFSQPEVRDLIVQFGDFAKVEV